MCFGTVPCGWYIQAQKGEFPTKGDHSHDDRNKTVMWAYQSFSLESYGGPAAQFSGIFPYVSVCVADNVLDLVDSWLELSIFEYGHRVVR